jgi:hypothetical protein
MVTLALLAAGMGLGYMTQAMAPDWSRWHALVVVQLALGYATMLGPNDGESAARRLALKTLLWPVVGAAMTGTARLAGVQVFFHVQWLTVLSLAGAHALGEWLMWRSSHGGRIASSGADRAARRQSWLLDVQWLLTIAGVPWCWSLVVLDRIAPLIAGGVVFLWLVRSPVSPGSRPPAPDTGVCRKRPPGWAA